jgi:hypothetical protein
VSDELKQRAAQTSDKLWKRQTEDRVQQATQRLASEAEEPAEPDKTLERISESLPDTRPRRRRRAKTETEIGATPDTVRVDEKRPKRVPIRDDDEPDTRPGKFASNTRELLADAITGLYWVPAQLTGLKEWELSEDEAGVLAVRVEAILKTGFDKKRAAKINKTIERFLPAVSLIVAASIITLPRIRLTKAARDNHSRTASEAARRAGRSHVEQSATSSAQANAGGNSERRARALTTADINEFGGTDAQ